MSAAPSDMTLPTLSELASASFDHLLAAADYYDRAGELTENAFTQLRRTACQDGSNGWEGQAAQADQYRAETDLMTVNPAVLQWHEAASICRDGYGQMTENRRAVLDAVNQARADGFEVGDDYTVTDTRTSSTPEEQTARQAQATAHAAYIRHRVAALMATDHDIATRLNAATKGVDRITFHEAPATADEGIDADTNRNGVALVDFRTPIPERPKIEPDPPPGGWSNDPLMRAAQKIAYGHAWTEHGDELPGMTKDQLADVVYDMFKRSGEDPGSLVIGRTADGAPVIYDPKQDVMVIRDPKALDAGTVYKPDVPDLEAYLGKKIPTRIPSLPSGELEDITPGHTSIPAEPRPAPTGGENATLRPPAQAPSQAPPPRTGGGPRGMPGLPYGIGTPWDSPATGPHPIHIPHTKDHGPPVLGEIPEEFEGPEP